MRRRIHAAALTAVTLAGSLLPAGPAQAAPECDVPNPMPSCFGDEGDPDGKLEGVQRVPGGVQVTGWASDPDGGAVRVDISIDETAVGSVTTNVSTGRFAGTVPARNGSRVCATAINNDLGSSKSIGCKTLTITVDPVGVFETLSHQSTDVTVTGWALDQDTSDPIVVDVYSDGEFVVTATANGHRPDVGAAYPGYGDQHGFSVTIPERPTDGDHTVCVYALNNVPFTHNPQLGCKTYTVRHNPVGYLDEVTRTGETVRVRGWTADPDEPTTPVDVHIYVDGIHVRSVTANGDRPDVADVFPQYGAQHGYVVDLTADMTPGTHTVCVDAINRSHGTVNTRLGCKDYSVPASVVAPTIKPFGQWDVRSDQIILSWTDHSTSEEGYRVERSDAGGPWHEIGSLGPDATVKIDRHLTPNTRYCYRVTAYNERNEASAEVCTTTLFAPLPAASGLTVVSRTDTSLTVKWTDNAEGEDNYRIGWHVADDPTAVKVITLAANPSTGEMTYTITGLLPFTEYQIAVAPMKAGHDTTTTVEGRAWTTGAPRIDEFTSSPSAIEACTTTSVTLNWKTTGATRVVVKRGSQILADKTQTTPAQWTGSTSGGSHDGNVTYTITAYSPDGRTTTENITVNRYSSLPLVKNIEFTNIGWNTLEVWYYDLNDNKLQQVGNVAPGGRITVTPGHCTARRIKVIDPTNGRIAFQTNPQIILGHNEGISSQQAVS